MTTRFQYAVIVPRRRKHGGDAGRFLRNLLKPYAGCKIIHTGENFYDISIPPDWEEQESRPSATTRVITNANGSEMIRMEEINGQWVIV